jgi:predicted MFS family arabinose efflux permease
MADRPPFSRRHLAFALGVICFANFLNYLDRQVVSALESEIRPAFGMSKPEFGTLWSAFTIGYMVFAPLVGYAAVRWRRNAIFAACVLVWSLATIGSGLADSKLELYLCRFLIGVGEAGCLVIGPTLVVDLFSAGVRGRALSLFYLGMPLGGTAGYIVGGVVTEHFGGWRNAFLVAGAPGLLVALLILLLPEPARIPAPAGTRHGGLAPYRTLIKNRTLMLIILAQAFAVMILVPLLHFGIAFFEQERGMSKVEATTYLGVIGLVGGIVGSVLAGFLGDRLATRTPGAYALIAGFAYAIALPALWIGFTVRERPERSSGVSWSARPASSCACPPSTPRSPTSCAPISEPWPTRSLSSCSTSSATWPLPRPLAPPRSGSAAPARPSSASSACSCSPPRAASSRPAPPDTTWPASSHAAPSPAPTRPELGTYPFRQVMLEACQRGGRAEAGRSFHSR